jgi:hypothetical protein
LHSCEEAESQLLGFRLDSNGRSNERTVTLSGVENET